MVTLWRATWRARPAAKPVSPSQETAIITALTAPGNTIAHVVVLAHGWNNDMDEARTLYRDFLRHLEAAAGPAAATIAGIGVLWPSKKFTDADLIPGGAASADQDPQANAVLLKRLDELKNLFGELEEIRRLIAALAGPERIQSLAAGVQAISAQIVQLQKAASSGSDTALRPLLEEIRTAPKLTKELEASIGAAVTEAKKIFLVEHPQAKA